jgi:hypothetical protein
MPCVGLKPTIPASELAKTVHASDRSATVTGLSYHMKFKFCFVILLVLSPKHVSVLLNFRVPKPGRRESSTLMEYALGLLDLLCVFIL